VLISPAGPYGEKLARLGFKWIPAPMERRSLNPLRELALLAWLRRLIRAENADIVHGFTIKCAVYAAFAARLAGVARVSAVAGMGYVFISDERRARILRPIVRNLMRAVFGGARSRLILQNPDDLAFFETMGVTCSENIRLIPGSGVDCTRSLPPATDQRHEPLRVVLAARMLWDKGIGEFVEAARRLRAENRPLEFILAGDPDRGNPAAIPESILRDWQAEGLVEWLGHIDDMPTLLAGADIVVLPSYREGLPKTLIEAAACARPLVTCDVPGCRHVVRDGVDGLLVPPRDAEALARAIAKLQDDPELAASLGNMACLRALNEFDERIVIERTIAIYNELVPGNEAHAGPSRGTSG
jgi:glycosyltransferase involved in cell wall biosynthesis